MPGSALLKGEALGSQHALEQTLAESVPAGRKGPQPRQSGGYCKEILGRIFVRPGNFRGQDRGRAQQSSYLMFTPAFLGLTHPFLSLG